MAPHFCKTEIGSFRCTGSVGISFVHLGLRLVHVSGIQLCTCAQSSHVSDKCHTKRLLVTSQLPEGKTCNLTHLKAPLSLMAPFGILTLAAWWRRFFFALNDRSGLRRWFGNEMKVAPRSCRVFSALALAGSLAGVRFPV